MKIEVSIKIEYKMSDFETLDTAKDKAIDKLVNTLDDWLNQDGIPPIIQIEYKIPDEDNNDNIYLN
tara:strand:+ start:519 stop:716 length:198 start_codon:yes stop_codon:yes gene_type:complete